MTTIAQVKAAHLRTLKGTENPQDVAEWSNRDLRQPQGFIGERCIDIEHRGLLYCIGRWTGWHGDFWAHEGTTGIIYRGSLADCKDWIITCSAAHHEPHGYRHIR